MTDADFWEGLSASPKERGVIRRAYEAALIELAMKDGHTDRHRRIATAIVAVFELGARTEHRLFRAGVAAGFERAERKLFSRLH